MSKFGDGLSRHPLKEVSFDGYLTVELAADRSDPEKVARESVRFLQSMLDH